MSVLAILVGIATLSVFLVLWMKRRYSMWKDMGALYEPPHLFFGNLKDENENAHDGELLQKFYQKFKGKGPFVGIFFFLRPVAVVLDIELVKNVLIKDFDYFHDRGVYFHEEVEPISAHLFALPGMKWKQLRNKLSPTFTSGKMKMMFPTVVAVGRKLESKLEEMSKLGKDVDIKAIMARYTVDAIGSCAFGLDCNSLEDDSSEFFQVGMSVFQNPRHGTIFAFLMMAFQDFAYKLKMKNFRDEVSEFFSNIVRKTIDYRIEKNVHRSDFMDLLIELYKRDGEDRLTFNEILAQAFIFFIGGFETSSTTLQFCFYCLASNQDIQDKLRNHIEEVLSKHNGELTYDAMMDMKYLDQVINETLRLYPPASTHVRVTTKDYNVPGTSCILKKGTTVMIPLFAIHRDPEFYPNPLKFDPENFSDENVKSRPPILYQPFGDGPRICIGARFALMQVKLGLIATLRKTKLTLSSKTIEPLRLESRFFIAHVKGGIWLNIEPVIK